MRDLRLSCEDVGGGARGEVDVFCRTRKRVVFEAESSMFDARIVSLAWTAARRDPIAASVGWEGGVRR